MTGTSGIADDDGTANAVFAYRWLADDAAIGGATASTYTVVAGDVGKVIKVRGGEVVKARRLEKGKNVRWEITVQPDGDGTVTIVLPATTDCASDGAICTSDGRKRTLDLVTDHPMIPREHLIQPGDTGKPEDYPTNPSNQSPY